MHDIYGHDHCERCVDEINGKYEMPNENFTECVPISIRRNNWTAAIITLSSIGLIFATVITSFYICHRQNPLIKASGRKLSYIMFVGKCNCCMKRRPEKDANG